MAGQIDVKFNVNPSSSKLTRFATVVQVPLQFTFTRFDVCSTVGAAGFANQFIEREIIQSVSPSLVAHCVARYDATIRRVDGLNPTHVTESVQVVERVPLPTFANQLLPPHSTSTQTLNFLFNLPYPYQLVADSSSFSEYGEAGFFRTPQGERKSSLLILVR